MTKASVSHSMIFIAGGVCLLWSLLASDAAVAPDIIPLPVSLQTRPGSFTLRPGQIVCDAASLPTAQYLESALSKSTGFQFQVVTSTATAALSGAILITTSNAVSSLGAEGYELTVAPDSVIIRAPQQAGAFYGVQSLLQLLPPQIYAPDVVADIPWIAPCVNIKDHPRFPWRGVMLDVSRHFFDKAEIEQLLDAMAMHKLNRFHWHLVDDQGWRLQITNYPNLTTTGAWRNGIDYGLARRSSKAFNAGGRYGGYYTQADAAEIVAYAAERHITVVPEIEIPCHAAAGLAAYPQFGSGQPAGDYSMDYPHIHYSVDLYSPGAPGTMPFFEDVLSEVMGIFPGKYIHCGGDEVTDCGDRHWNTYPPDVANMKAHGIVPNGMASIVKYQHWLSTRLADFVQSKGRMMMGWTEIENAGIIPNAALMDWESGSPSKAVAAAEAGRPVVMSFNNSGYLNYVEGHSNSLPIEPPFFIGNSPRYLAMRRVYNFEPIPAGLPEKFQGNILGAQCALWTEYVPSFRNVMFKMFPRETALAEATWTPKASLSYSNFIARLAVEKKRFAQMGLNYDHEFVPRIGRWGGAISTTPLAVVLNITPYLTAAGEIDVNFWHTGGSALAISSVALLRNGMQVDIDKHDGLAAARPEYPLYVLHLPKIEPGATYALRAVIAGKAGTNAPSAKVISSGSIYLPNWD